MMPMLREAAASVDAAARDAVAMRCRASQPRHAGHAGDARHGVRASLRFERRVMLRRRRLRGEPPSSREFGNEAAAAAATRCTPYEADAEDEGTRCS